MNSIVIFLIALLISLFSCSNSDPVASNGSGTGTGNPIIMGSVHYSDDKPVVNGAVRVRKSTSSMQVVDYSYLGDEFDTNGIVYTDSFGEYSFSVLEEGDYLIEVSDSNSNGFATPLVIGADSSKILRPIEVITLDTIRGQIGFYGAEPTYATLYILGTDRYIIPDTLGRFSIPVASGRYEYSLAIFPGSEKYLAKGVWIKVSDTTFKDIKFLAKNPTSTGAIGDSLIIRAILDSNKLYSIDVNQVTVRDTNNRITIFDVHPDKSDSGFINISSYITTIPQEICGLTKLEELEIQYTYITTLPDSIGKLTTLKELELNYNDLTSLPSSITALTPTVQLDLSKNLLTLEGELKEWADTYQLGWDTLQR